MPAKDIQKKISTLQTIKSANAFPSYIDYIRFPYYKSLAENTRIDFEFPVTVFVGKNGCGKSSTVQALYGCPEGKSLGNFWFSTNLDPIVEPDSNKRNCLIYSYQENQESKEVLKQRILRKDDPDYWEPARPNLKYNMSPLPGRKRNKAITKNVVYIDFKSVLSAFDKYFYFHQPRTNTKQNYLRDKSSKVKIAFETNKIFLNRSTPPEKINAETIIFDETQCLYLSKILGKKYTQVKLLKHSFYGSKGLSVFMQTDHNSYSEAFAGSGETAAAVLVHDLTTAEDTSLVLLDEPEVSLHPGAQKELLNFILDLTIKKKFQVIISTHAPAIVEFLPAKAIKLFQPLANGKVSVQSEITYNEAFSSIGHTVSDKINLIVEDKLTEFIISTVCKKISSGYIENFHITFQPGGSSRIKQQICDYSMDEASKKFVIFDGDQKADVVNPLEFTIQQKNSIFLKNQIELLTKQSIKFHPDAGDSNSEKSKIQLMTNYLDFYFKKVSFLPSLTPEDLIWDNETAKTLMNELSINEEIQQNVFTSVNSKEKFKKISDLLSDADTSNEIFMIQKIFVKKWANIESEQFVEIKAILKLAVDSFKK